MCEDFEGFLHPQIDSSKCVDCGLCAKICPVNHPQYNNHTPTAYAACASNDIRAKSSSGGVFTVLAQHILQLGGAVCGAAFNPAQHCVEHIVVSSIDDLKKLQSSKYVQSDVKFVYSEIKKLLANGRIVLFSGTPCQNAGVRAVCGSSENLYCCDLVCHGVPSPKVFRKYLDELALDGDFVQTDFRDKVNGWKPQLTVTTFTTTAKYSNPATEDDYMLAFLKNLSLRKTCGKCPFNKLPRQGDLTLGDFWGAPKKYDDMLGTSVILANSPRGAELLSAIQPQLKLLANVSLSKVLPSNPCINSSSAENPLRSVFFAELDKMTLHDNVEALVTKKYDYLCLNFWTSLNYGAVLTAYASQQLLAELGYTSAHIDYRYPHITQDKFNDSFTDQFAKKYLNHTFQCRGQWDFDQLNRMARRGFIVGSDQVFRDDYISETYFWYLLGFADPQKQRVALAASFGKNSFKMLSAKPFFECFDALSVREDSGVNFLPNAKHILDPVFLADVKIFHALADSVETPPCKVVGYILDQTDVQFDRNIATEHLSVEQYLSFIKNAELLITDSFHGACFAILFKRPFLSLGNASRGNSRFESLFRDLKIEDTQNIDWEKIDRQIAVRRAQSIEWLKSALDKKEIKNVELRNKLKKNLFWDRVKRKILKKLDHFF